MAVLQLGRAGGQVGVGLGDQGRRPVFGGRDSAARGGSGATDARPWAQAEASVPKATKIPLAAERLNPRTSSKKRE